MTSGFARLVVALRFLILPAWILVALGALTLPGLGSGSPLALGGLLPDESDAIEAGERSAELFSVPLTSDTVVVQRDPGGLSARAQARAVERAVRVTRQQGIGDEITFALPVLNSLGVFPSSKERGTTAVTYLFFSPGTSLPEQVDLAHAYAGSASEPEDAVVGVTGPAPARFRQFEELEQALPIVEAGTVALIALIVGLTFRSLGAPLLTLFASGVSFLIARGVIPWVGVRLDATVPQEVEPLVVALTLGVVTDYTVFYLSASRRRLAEGETRLQAVRTATRSVTPIVATAGLIVVAGTAALLVGELDFFRAFGPALALTAGIALLVSVTLVPACLAIFGRWAFWPSLRPGRPLPPGESRPTPAREAALRFAVSPVVSAIVAVGCVAVLLLASTGLRDTALAFRLVNGLPAGTEERQAASAAGQGFAAGILAPTVVLVERAEVTEEREALDVLAEGLAKQPGVAAVLGPGRLPAETPRDVFLAEEGNAARFAVILDESPLGSPAIADLDGIDERLPGLLRSAGLDDASAALTGQTAVASDTVHAVVDSSVRVGIVVLGVNFLLLALFLRAVVAPLYLLAASLLSVAATLGLTTYVFQGLLGHDDLTYYVPFAAGVLLVSLGSDYNVFVTGRIWEEARRRPLREAIAVAAPRASRAISVAGLALALSFAMLAVVPLDGFREFAFMMGVGVLVETFVVRSLLIPALISLFGRSGAWPGRVLEREPTRAPLAGRTPDPQRTTR